MIYLLYNKLYQNYKDAICSHESNYSKLIKETIQKINDELKEKIAEEQKKLNLNLENLKSSIGPISSSITIFPGEKCLYDIHRELFNEY